DERKAFRQNPAGEDLADRGDTDVTHPFEIAVVVLLLTAHVVGYSNTDFVVTAAQDVVSQSFAGREEADFLVAMGDNRTALDSHGVSAVVARLNLRGQTHPTAPLGQVRLKQFGEDDAAAVLPLL